MADPNLDRQLDELFSNLTTPEAPPTLLDNLFSAEANLLAPPAAGRALPTTNPPADPRALIDQLSRWDIDPLLETLTDANQELAAAALFNLLQQHQAANRRVLSLANKPGRPALAAGSQIYISHLLGQKFIFVPPGPFLMGSNPASDELATGSEQPQHTLNLPGYWIARYLVTAAQYHIFLAQTGHRPVHQPDRSAKPVTHVTWFDALAYCRWLSDKSGLTVTLPSEAEWEKAARGSDGRRYPWGNQPPSTQVCNFSQITPVGQYSPQGDSPYNCADMAGNVWEWTRSGFKPYPYQPKDGRENFTDNQPRVVRGLTFNNPQVMTRCAYRYRLEPQLDLPTLGFRVLVSPESF